MSFNTSPCTCATLGPAGECIPCEKWKCRLCLRVFGWYDSGTDDDDGVCDECRHPQTASIEDGRNCDHQPRPNSANAGQIWECRKCHHTSFVRPGNRACPGQATSSGGEPARFTHGQRVEFKHNGTGPLYGNVALRSGSLVVVDEFGDWARLDSLTDVRATTSSGGGESSNG